MSKLRFRASLVRMGSHVCLLLPRAAGAKLGDASRTAVAATINGVPAPASVFRMRGGVRMMLVNREMREGSRASVGDRVEVTIAVDEVPRAVRVPPDLARALARSRRARAAAPASRG